MRCRQVLVHLVVAVLASLGGLGSPGSPIEADEHNGMGDGKEGVNAFLEKRPAQFTGKASEMPAFYPWWE